MPRSQRHEERGEIERAEDHTLRYHAKHEAQEQRFTLERQMPEDGTPREHYGTICTDRASQRHAGSGPDAAGGTPRDRDKDKDNTHTHTHRTSPRQPRHNQRPLLVAMGGLSCSAAVPWAEGYGAHFEQRAEIVSAQRGATRSRRKRSTLSSKGGVVVRLRRNPGGREKPRYLSCAKLDKTDSSLESLRGQARCCESRQAQAAASSKGLGQHVWQFHRICPSIQLPARTRHIHYDWKPCKLT